MATAHWREGLLKTVNIVAYLLFLGADIYTVVSPQPIYNSLKETYFTPTIWAFFVWPVIHILLLGTVIYQFASTRGETLVVGGISWEFPLMITLYAIFVTVWANHYHTAAFVVSLFLVYVIGYIYRSLRMEHPPKSVGDELLVHLPISVCQAWAIVICFMTAFEALGVDATEDKNGFWTNIFVLFALLTLQMCAGTFALSPAIGDRPAAFIISWAVWTISDHQRSSTFIHGAATFFFFMSIPWDFVAMDSMYRRCTGRANFTANDERNPLLYGR